MNQLYLPIIWKVTQEGFHNAFNKTLPVAGHTIWHLIRTLRKEALACTRIIQCENGQDEQKKKYRKIDDKIANLVANYESKNVMEWKCK